MKTVADLITLACGHSLALFRSPRWALIALPALVLFAAAPAARAQADQFISAGSLHTARGLHTATLLPNGQVLVAGGVDASFNTTASAELYDPRTGAWAATGSLSTARNDHTATLLPNGGVLVVGGDDEAGDALASAELYNPSNGIWTVTGSLNTARAAHTATLLPNGQVLVAGGADTAGNSIASAELYDPASGTWTATGNLDAARQLHTATLLPNGQALVAGGYGASNALASSELYDPSTGVWTPTSGGLHSTRLGQTATLLPNGQVLVAGGVPASNSSPLASAEIYDPASGTWAATGSLNAARTFHTATLLPDGQVLVVGGVIDNGVSLASAEIYDPSGETWTPTGNLNAARYEHTATLLPSGQVLVAGGTDINGPISMAERYNPASGSWAGTGSLNTGRSNHTATLLPDGEVLVAAGFDGGAVASAELYNPAGGVWTTTGSLNAARLYHTATLLPNGQVLVAGGTPGSGFLASAELYDPTTGRWTVTGSLNTARSLHTATLLPNGHVLVAGGLGTSGVLASAELYDPATGTWTATGSLNVARKAHTATLLPNGQLLAAGGANAVEYLVSAELFDPTSGAWTSTGNLNDARGYHTATLLPNGQVLAAAGLGLGGVLASAELYDAAIGSWTTTGSLASARNFHTATLLPNGQLVVAGGGGNSNTLASVELYDPASGVWTTTGSLNTARELHTVTLLPNGMPLAAGGVAGGYLASAELYNVGLGFSPSSQPRITGAASPLLYGGAFTLNGAGFLGISGGSGGGTNDSPTNYPLVQLLSLVNEQSVYLPVSSITPASATNFVSGTVVGIAPGYALATVIANGIPSASAIVQVQPGLPAVQTSAAMGVGSSGATLNATVSSEGAPAAVSFEYSTDPGLLNAVTVTAPQTLEYNAAGSAVSQGISGLAPSTTYYCRAVASSAAGSVQGNIVSFTTTSTLYFFFSGAPASKGLVLNVVGFLESGDDGATVTSVGNPSFGTATISSDQQSIIYTPRVSFANLGVYDTFTFVYTDPTLQVTTTETVTIGNFAYALRGSYDGLLTALGGSNVVGYLQVTLTGTGAFTGSLKYGAKTFPFKGQFGLEGSAPIVELSAPVGFVLAPDPIHGAISVDSNFFGAAGSTMLTPSAYAAAGNAPQAGAYTVLLPAPAEPTGGSTATATATVTAGKITSITPGNAGSGYLAAPLVSIYGAGGNGAVVTASISGGSVVTYKIVDGGGHYPTASGAVTVTIDPPSDYLPGGAGYGLMSVAPNGVVTVAGKLADGTAWSTGGFLKAGNTAAFYASLPYKPGPTGTLSGTLTFRDIAATSDADGALTWTKPAESGVSIYPGGFTASLNAIASRYFPPVAKQQALVFSDTTAGVATVALQGGDLATPISDTVTVSSANIVTEQPPTADKLKLTITKTSGLIGGSFTGGFAIGGAPTKSLSANFSGVLFQKQNAAHGFFVEGNHSGEIDVTAQ